MNRSAGAGPTSLPSRRWLMGVLGGLALLAFSAVTVLAQAGISASNTKVESRFAEYIRYSVTLQSDSEITSATVFARYNTGDNTSTTSRGTATFTPDKTVTAVFTRTLQRGDLIPGALVDYFWEVTDAAGHSLKTDSAKYTYLDDRFEFKSLSKPIGKGSLTVYWYGADQAYGQKRLDVAVAAIQKLQTQTGVDLTTDAQVWLYRTRDEMLAALPFKGATSEASLVTLGELAGPRTVFLLGSDGGIDNTTYHELSHLVVHLATNNPLIGGVSIPAWLDEGLSMYNQQSVERGYTDSLDRALRSNSLISVRSASAVPGPPDQVILFYGEAYSMVKYLVETYGKDNMQKLLAVFKKGSSVDDALKATYGFGLQEFDARWRASLGAPGAVVNTPAAGSTTAPGAVTQPTSAPVSPPASSSAPFACACLPGAALVVLWLFMKRASG
jgi:hypothetical protein